MVHGLMYWASSQLWSIYFQKLSMSRKFGFWSDKFNDGMCNLKFWLISGVEHSPIIFLFFFTGMGRIYQMLRLNYSHAIISSQAKMPLKLSACIPERADTQHMAPWGWTSRWKGGGHTVAQNCTTTGIASGRATCFSTFHPPVFPSKQLNSLSGYCDLVITGMNTSEDCGWQHSERLCWCVYFSAHTCSGTLSILKDPCWQVLTIHCKLCLQILPSVQLCAEPTIR